MTFKWVWAGAALIVPNIVAQASAPSMRLRVVRMVDPPGFVVDCREV
jgi:energy-converting hydrogenase Eha subunit E